MSTPLVSAKTLIRESWTDFIRDWNHTFRIAAWLVLFPAIFFFVALVASPYENVLFWTFVALTIMEALMAIWIGIRLTRWILVADRGEKIEKNERSLALVNILPFLLVGILEGLAVLGGMLLFVFPGIYLAVAFMFSQFFLMEDGVWGTHALSASYALVKGRWWPTFWRVLATGFVFALLLIVGLKLLTGLLQLIAGSSKLSIVLEAQTLANPIAYGARRLLDTVGQAIFLPIFITWQVKLFHALKKSR